MVFYLFYRSILAKDKLFIRNRFYLISTSVLAFILPWIRIPIIPVHPEQSFSLAYINNTASGTELVKPEYQSISWIHIILLIYISGGILFLLKSLLSYFHVFILIKEAYHFTSGRFKIVTTAKKVSPFSFFSWIVIPKSIQEHPSFDKMVQHEIVHCRQYHSVDLFICELLIILQWFNPFAWLLRRAVSENLEFLVDEQMLSQGTNARDYQYSLLSFSMGGSNPAVANKFNSHLLKKRITMMNTRKYSRNHRLHNVLIPVCLVFALLLTASFRKEVSNTAETPVKNKLTENLKLEKPAVNAKPRASMHKNETVTSFEVAGEQYVLGYIAQNIIYPKSAISMNLEATVEVIVKFGSNGVEIQEHYSASVTKFKEVVVIAYGMESGNTLSTSNAQENNILVEEVKRVLKSLSNIPEELVGKTVMIPVKFLIEKREQKITENESRIEENNSVENKNMSGFLEPVYILNDEKIISKKEMEAIDVNTIQSVEVRKSPTFHSKFGDLKGGAVIITLKK